MCAKPTPEAWAADVHRRLDALSPGAFLALAHREPAFVAMGAAAFATLVTQCAEALSIRPATLARALPANPHVVTIDHRILKARVRAIADLLGIEDVGFVALRFISHAALFSLDSDHLAGRLAALSVHLRLSVKDTIALLRRHPQLLLQPPDKLHAKIAHRAAALDIDEPTMLRMVQRRPELLQLAPDTLATNRDRLSHALGLKASDIVRMARHHPQILYQNTDTLTGNLEGLARLLSVAHARMKKAARLQPQLLFQSPPTVRHRVDVAAETLGLLPEEYLAAALRSPALFTADPKTLKKNVLEHAKQLRLQAHEALAFMQRQPQLLMARAATTRRKASYLRHIARALNDTRPLPVILCRHAMALTFSRERLFTLLSLARADPAATMGVMLKRKTSTYSHP